MPLRIENAIDMHCHFGPDTVGPIGGGMELSPEMADAMHHSVTGYDAAKEACESGHRAIVLKSHSFCSAQLAGNLAQLFPGFAVFGGACTDHPSGGLSVSAVETALMLGARIVWLPTVSSCPDMAHRKTKAKGWPTEAIAVIDETGAPSALVRDIFDLCRQYDAILATGHTSAEEHYAVVKAFAREGKVLVTHAGEALAGPKLTPAQARDLADLGATVELTAECCVKVFDRPAKSAREMIEMIRTIGHTRCTLSSDYGWARIVPRPAPGLKEFLERLWDAGMSEADLTQMVATKPAELLGLG